MAETTGDAELQDRLAAMFAAAPRVLPNPLPQEKHLPSPTTRRLAIVTLIGAAGFLLGSAGPCAEDCTTITQGAWISVSSSERVEPSPLEVGDTATVFFLTCTCMLCHQTSATWRSVVPEVATVTGRGTEALVTAVGVGTTTVQAESTGEIDGRVWTAEATVVVAGSR